MARERDYAYEALAESTDAHQDANRGELNVALKSIREQTGVEDSYVLADLIIKQARRYREVMGDEVMITPTALAKHWTRVGAEATRAPRATNQAAVSHDECPTCKGDRFVVVGTRPVVATQWMKDRGIEVGGDASIDEYTPCPTCNSQVDASFRRYDGSRALPPDPAHVREWMSR